MELIGIHFICSFYFRNPVIRQDRQRHCRFCKPRPSPQARQDAMSYRIPSDFNINLGMVSMAGVGCSSLHELLYREENNLEAHHAIKFCVKLTQNNVETYEMLQVANESTHMS